MASTMIKNTFSKFSLRPLSQPRSRHGSRLYEFGDPSRSHDKLVPASLEDLAPHGALIRRPQPTELPSHHALKVGTKNVLSSIKAAINNAPPWRDFVGSLKESYSRTGLTGLIADVKKASPSRGVLREDFGPEGFDLLEAMRKIGDKVWKLYIQGEAGGHSAWKYKEIKAYLESVNLVNGVQHLATNIGLDFPTNIGLDFPTVTAGGQTVYQRKIVWKVTKNSDKKSCKALKIAAGFDGVESASIEGSDKDQITVVTGEGIDPLELVILLRKYTELVSVGPVEEKKPEAKELKATVVEVNPYQYYYN